jgi:RNA polymerase sigma-70 factor (ECF subfamily)
MTVESATLVPRFQSGIFPKFDIAALDFDDDEILVRGMLDGIPRAWRAFQRRFERLVIQQITKVTRHFRALVAPDEVHDIYASFYVSLLANDKYKLRAFDPERGSRLSTWIALLATHRAYDYLRARRREPETADLEEARGAPGETPDPFERFATGERASIASNALRGLSKKDRAFARLYFGEGLEPTEVAAKLRVSVKTVYSKKHKMRLRLASLLKQAAA